jgi:hypothetical protein
MRRTGGGAAPMADGNERESAAVPRRPRRGGLDKKIENGSGISKIIYHSCFFKRNDKRFAVIFIRRSFNSTTEKRRVSVEQH